MATKEEEISAGEFVSSMQMCNLFAELMSDIEGMKTKLNFPYYKNRKNDSIIKKNFDEILQILSDESHESCNQARSKFIKLAMR